MRAGLRYERRPARFLLVSRAAQLPPKGGPEVEPARATAPERGAPLDFGDAGGVGPPCLLSCPHHGTDDTGSHQATFDVARRPRCSASSSAIGSASSSIR